MKRDSITNIYIGIGLVFTIIIIGTIGYRVIEGFSFMESFFMTAITISTVGYREIHPLSSTGMVFTVFLIFLSLGIFGYVITTVTRYIVDGVFRNYYKDNKVKKRIKKLSNHVVVCGYGRNGRQAAIELEDHNESFVIVENNESEIDGIREANLHLYIQGDATHEDVLGEAQVETAKALITTLPNDADNLFVVITARQMNPKLTIISRASDDNSDIKLKRAGADNVIMPDRIGGQRMAKLVAQPDVVEFIEYIMLQTSKDVSLEEISCKNIAPCFMERSIGELQIRNLSGSNIIGLRTEDRSYVFNPPPETILNPKDQLFVLGNSEQINKLKTVLMEGV